MRIPLNLSMYGTVASNKESIYSLSIAVKLPPKKAISALIVFSFKELIAVSIADTTSVFVG